MKGGNIDRVTAKHICITSLTLIITTILHMARQNLPFDATAFLSRSMPFFSSELHDIPNSSMSIEPTRNSENENSHNNTAEGTNVSGKAFGGDNASSSIPQACDYSNGRWVADSRRPLYFPFECKYLSNSWSCRRTHRKDFSYERHRWQPKNCEIQEFNHSAFLRRMQNKTIAFVGDSLGRQQFQSLLCMVTARKNSPEVEDVSTKYDLFNPYGPIRGAVHGAGWAYRFPSSNTTVLCYWSVSLCDLEPLNTTDPPANNASVAIHLDRPVPFMKKFLHQFDILVLNTGHHWNEDKFSANHWVMYVNGKPNEDTNLADYWNARNFTVYNTVRWLNSQLPLHPRLKAFFRTISPKHFKNGDWNTGGSCDNTVPLTRGSEVLQEESSDATVAGAVEGTGVKILDITALSDLRDEAHISSYNRRTKGANDCLHWCLPGIPDTWNEILFAQV